MTSAIISAAVMVHVQFEDFAPLIHRLEIQSEAVNPLLARQGKTQNGLAVKMPGLDFAEIVRKAGSAELLERVQPRFGSGGLEQVDRFRDSDDGLPDTGRDLMPARGFGGMNNRGP